MGYIPFMEIISEKLEKQFQKFLSAAFQYFSQLLLKARLLEFLSTGRTLKNIVNKSNINALLSKLTCAMTKNICLFGCKNSKNY